MERQTRADLAMTIATLMLASSLMFSGASLLRLHEGTLGAPAHFGLAELLGIVAAAVGLALLCWWALALICAFLGAWAQSKGSVRATAVSESLSPAFMRRLVVAVLGLNLLAAPLANAVTTPGPDPRWHAETVATAPAATAPAPSGGTEAVLPHWVPHTVQTNPGPLLSPARRPATEPPQGQAAAQDQRAGRSAPAAAAEVVVQRGDSLWSIVATALGPFCTEVDVAQAWPAWYQANRATIGPNPHLILPGQVLHAPSGP
ncbi:LysM peptidoglycan-binding domain-containing protein [Specibacter sp. NPDC057265]|uniref:LysM peptidoglycan-binding domain-containing protein n=1 Tax=Specibacter sp. NPDC057265 TaxID=3346075 RepID=UPI00363DC842